MDLKLLFEQSLAHRTEHDCSAYPYEEYEKLVETVQLNSPKTVLEIGTGMGFTAAVIAQAAPNANITTIEKDPEHIEYAKQFWVANNVVQQITPIVAQAEVKLHELPGPFDFIFFDGYQIHYEFLPHYERLLRQGGILYLANNHLKSKTSDQFFDELENSGKWQILQKFADTTIAKKL